MQMFLEPNRCQTISSHPGGLTRALHYPYNTRYIFHYNQWMSCVWGGQGEDHQFGFCFWQVHLLTAMTPNMCIYESLEKYVFCIFYLQNFGWIILVTICGLILQSSTDTYVQVVWVERYLVRQDGWHCNKTNGTSFLVGLLAMRHWDKCIYI